MDKKSFHELLLRLGASPDAVDFIVHREAVVEWMRGLGYAERTIANNVQASAKGGLISRLMAQGLIENGGLKRWRVPSVAKLAEADKPREKKSVVKYYEGNPPPENKGWILFSSLNDDEKAIEWRLYVQKYGPEKLNIKVVVMGRVPNKANYWMCSKKGDLLHNRDASLLEDHHPDIYKNLLEDLNSVAIADL
jgi:hypothetical protein